MTFSLILGPMYSGKTSELLRLVDRKAIAGKSCLVVKYEADNRYNTDENTLSTHDGNRHKAVPCNGKLLESNINFEKYDVIAIDEGQFMSDLPQFVEKYVKNKNIIVSALAGTFERKPWESISNSLPYATNVEFLTAVCGECNSENACYNKKINGNKNQVTEVGGKDIYQSQCNNCF